MDSVTSPRGVAEAAGGITPMRLEQSCTTRRVFDLVADKWMLSILCTLSEGRARYSAVQRAVVGITPKVLTQHLRSLETSGLLTRTVYPVVPPHVEYELTDLGRSLRRALQPLLAWGESHLDEVEQAQSAHHQ
ncbi:winged helix-turn-helix transcriptional regulator [Actinacidiphila yeochonensis]|uniref:winged helix-turn-helix transcriptional regulator n=1 Tax=Actinacidiphila yeochonensis TaxID=89050 RepID=UPI001E4B1A7A|nr:helix-turn-helix domain-containing protein [Actinacidiphila yeochonensis]